MFRRIACAVVIVLPVLGCREEPAVPPTPPAPPVTPPPSPTAMGVSLELAPLQVDVRV